MEMWPTQGVVALGLVLGLGLWSSAADAAEPSWESNTYEFDDGTSVVLGIWINDDSGPPAQSTFSCDNKRISDCSWTVLIPIANEPAGNATAGITVRVDGVQVNDILDWSWGSANHDSWHSPVLSATMFADEAMITRLKQGVHADVILKISGAGSSSSHHRRISLLGFTKAFDSMP